MRFHFVTLHRNLRSPFKEELLSGADAFFSLEVLHLDIITPYLSPGPNQRWTEAWECAVFARTMGNVSRALRELIEID